jgi:hypothetical protein
VRKLVFRNDWMARTLTPRDRTSCRFRMLEVFEGSKVAVPSADHAYAGKSREISGPFARVRGSLSCLWNSFSIKDRFPHY